MYKGKEYKLSQEIFYFKESGEFGFTVSNMKEGKWYNLLTDGKEINNDISELPVEVQKQIEKVHKIITSLTKIKETFSIEKIKQVKEKSLISKDIHLSFFKIKNSPFIFEYVKERNGTSQLGCLIKDFQYLTVTNAINSLEHFFGEKIMRNIWEKVKKESSNRIRLIHFNEKAE